VSRANERRAPGTPQIRRLIQSLVALFVLVILLLASGAWLLRRTLPNEEEARAVRGLQAPVSIAYDTLGVAVITAASINDLAFAQGYAHARDRRFQMELFRRAGAGRLAEIFGPAALGADRHARTLGFARVADSTFAIMPAARRARLEAYAAGVNAFDRSHPKPPEFLVLGIPLEPWRPADNALVTLLLFDDLQFDGSSERAVEVMDAALPPALVRFLLPESTPGDVALDRAAAPPAPPTPPPADVDVRRGLAKAASGATSSWSPEHEAADERAAIFAWCGNVATPDQRSIGSNNWVVDGAHSASGGALVCNDPHLSLRVPVIWHRERLEAPGLDITGVSVPGTTDIIIGSNGRVAWGFTNVEGDFVDFVRVQFAGRDSSSYVGPAGPERFRTRTEVMRVKGAAAETLRVRETRWGPVIANSIRGGPLALEWGALDPTSCDFDMLDEARATNVRELLQAFDSFSGPAQNLVAGDRDGHIAWRIVGRLPRRAGFDPRRPRDGAAPNAGWFGWWPQDSMPGVIDPPGGFLATANQRTVGGRMWDRVGTGAGMPWRAHRIAELLAGSDGAKGAARMIAIQNDVRDDFLEDTDAALAAAESGQPQRPDSAWATARALHASWRASRGADTTSAGHAFMRYVRLALHQELLQPLLAPCVARDSTFRYSWSLEDEVVRRLLTERPPHLLNPKYRDYNALVRAATDTAAAWLKARVPGVPLERITWGMINRARINHPLGSAVPALDPWLDMPHAALSGGSSVVRVTRPTSGASMRMVVDLGAPDSSRFSLPGGQSGHFLSRHYGDEFADWVAGRYQPFYPAAARHTVRLTPN
jgi:penicillin G amidase